MRCFLALLAACSTPSAEVDAPLLDPGADANAPLPTLGNAEAVPVERGRPTGSSTIVPGRDGDLFMVDPLLDQVVNVHPDATTAFPVGGEPTRIARVLDTLYVTLRGAGEVVKTTLDGEILERVPVGLEPFGVVVTSDGRSVYVAVSLSNEILELDGDTLEVRRRWDLHNEPRYLALDETAGTLFVGVTRGEQPLHRIDLATGATSGRALPIMVRETVYLHGRITGDLWVVPETGELLAPALYFDPVTPVLDPTSDIPQPEAQGYGMPPLAGGNITVGRWNPAVVVSPPEGEDRALWASLPTARGYLTSVRSSPDASTYVATMEGMGALVFLDPDGVVDNDPHADPFSFTPPPDVSPTRGRFAHVPLSVVGAPALPTGITWTERGPVAHSTRSRGWAEIPLMRPEFELSLANDQGRNADNAGSWAEVTDLPGADPRPLDVREGEALFFSARPDVVGQGGVSCATCHIDGRDDGVSWPFVTGLRQTPSLAGVVSETAPVTWTDAVSSVSEEAQLTASIRMGGGVNWIEASNIQAFIDWTRPVRRLDVDDAANRGRLLFERSDVGCTNCHTGDRLTDGYAHELRGLQVATPGLNGVAATAPYLRDGTAADLYEVLDPEINGGMGDTSSLSAEELDDLVAYLRTL